MLTSKVYNLILREKFLRESEESRQREKKQKEILSMGALGLFGMMMLKYPIIDIDLNPETKNVVHKISSALISKSRKDFDEMFKTTQKV